MKELVKHSFLVYMGGGGWRVYCCVVWAHAQCVKRLFVCDSQMGYWLYKWWYIVPHLPFSMDEPPLNEILNYRLQLCQGLPVGPLSIDMPMLFLWLMTPHQPGFCSLNCKMSPGPSFPSSSFATCPHRRRLPPPSSFSSFVSSFAFSPVQFSLLLLLPVFCCNSENVPPPLLSSTATPTSSLCIFSVQ